MIVTDYTRTALAQRRAAREFVAKREAALDADIISRSTHRVIDELTDDLSQLFNGQGVYRVAWVEDRIRESLKALARQIVRDVDAA